MSYFLSASCPSPHLCPPIAVRCLLRCAVRRELSFWRRLFGFVEWSVLPAEWLDEQFRCADIAVLACKRRQERRPALSDDGSGDGMLGEFWSDYPNDARYVTKEAEVTAEAQHAP